ncbi:MAG: hypothetical protein Fur0023_18020 [Bacteroidia bacterium]
MKKNLIMYGLTVSSLLLTQCASDNNNNKETQQTVQNEPAVGGSASIKDETSKPTVLQIAMNSEQHKILVKAVQATGLVDVLAVVGPYTIFAPTDDAFKQLPQGTLDELLKPEKKSDLQNILEYHVTTSAYTLDKLKDGMTIGVANGGKIKVSVKDNKTYINDAEVIGFVEGSNGNILVINKVLIPQK